MESLVVDIDVGGHPLARRSLIQEDRKGMPDTTVIDPLGRSITLHDHTWFGHIIKGHPELRGDRALVDQAIRSPSTIRFSAADVNCRVYYGSGPAGLLLAVVADVVGGFVKTAYRTRAAKGVVEW